MFIRFSIKFHILLLLKNEEGLKTYGLSFEKNEKKLKKNTSKSLLCLSKTPKISNQNGTHILSRALEMGAAMEFDTNELFSLDSFSIIHSI